jgi:hypothetical protein
MIAINLITPEAAAKLELLFKKPASGAPLLGASVLRLLEMPAGTNTLDYYLEKSLIALVRE